VLRFKLSEILEKYVFLSVFSVFSVTVARVRGVDNNFEVILVGAAL